MSNVIKCPKCGNDQLHIGEKGYSLGKAAVGVVTLGFVGALAGLHGKNKIKIHCLKCGNTWIPNYDTSYNSSYSEPITTNTSYNRSYATTSEHSNPEPMTDDQYRHQYKFYMRITTFNIIVGMVLLVLHFIKGWME